MCYFNFKTINDPLARKIMDCIKSKKNNDNTIICPGPLYFLPTIESFKLRSEMMFIQMSKIERSN